MKNAKRQRFGVALALAMKARGISQSELALISGVGQSSLSLLLGGHRRPSLHTAILVADALHIELDDLMARRVTRKAKA